MRKTESKSGKKALANIHLQIPKSYVVLGLLSMALWQGCGKDEPAPPTPQSKIDHPTEFVLSTNNLPKGVDVNTSNKTITVPPSMSEKDIIALFEQGKVSDIDGDTGIKTVNIQNNKVIITIYGKNGKTGVIEEKVIEWKLIISDIVADFPEQISTSPIVAGDTTFISQLFATPIPLNDGTTATPQIQVNGETITNEYIFNKPGKYTLTLSITDSKNTPHSKDYQLTIDPKPITKNNLATYTKEYRKHFNSIDPRRQDRGQIEGVAERMKLGGFLEITHKVLKPSGKTVAFFNQKEGDWLGGPADHHIEKTSKEIFGTNPEIKYIDVIPTEDKGDPLFKSKLKETIRKHNFVITENNGGNMQNLRDITNSTNHGYVFSGEFGPDGKSPEILSNEGKGIVNYPVLYNDGDDRLYTDPHKGWTDPEDNPLMNSIDSPILGGLNLGGTSYATEGNAAIGAVLVNYCQRMGIEIDKATLNDLLKNHPERLQPVRYCYYPEGVEKTWDNIKWTDKVVAHILDLKTLITHKGTFDLNPVLKNLSKTHSRVPLFKHHDKLNYEYIKIEEEKGIIRENGIPYVDFNLLEQQGLTVDDLVYDIVVSDPSATDTYWWKGENLKVK